MSTENSKRLTITDDDYVYLGRTLRRQARTMMHLMNRLGINEEEIKFRRKTKKPSKTSRQSAETNKTTEEVV